MNLDSITHKVSRAREFRELMIKAEEGNANDQFRLGVKINLGDGVQANPKKALEWFRKAASQGESNAIFFLNSPKKKGKKS